jgi:hypothetical protein
MILLLLSFSFLKYRALSFTDWNSKENKKMRRQTNISKKVNRNLVNPIIIKKKQWKSTLDAGIYLLITWWWKHTTGSLLLDAGKQIFLSYKSSCNLFVNEKDMFIRNRNRNFSLDKISLNVNCYVSICISDR